MTEPTESLEARNPHGPGTIWIDLYPLMWGTVRAVVRGTTCEWVGSRTEAAERVWLRYAVRVDG